MTPFSQQISGPDEALLAFLGPARDLGIEAHVVLPHPGPYVERYGAAGASVHFAKFSILKRAMGPGTLVDYGARLARGVAGLGGLIRRLGIDIVHTNMEVVLDSGIAARRAGIPHVMHYRGNTLDSPRLVFDVLTRVWTANAMRVICISEGTAAIFRKRHLGDRVKVLTDPIDVATIARTPRSEDVRRQLGAAPDDVLVATVARIHPRKDVATFLRAGALLLTGEPRLRLAVIGDAEAPKERRYEAEMRALAAELGLDGRLTWAGVRRDIPSVVQAIDLFMLCSRNEGFGIAAAEAIAAGCPVVLTREGAFLEFARGREDVLATPEDPESFAGVARGLIQLGRRKAALSAVAIEKLMTPEAAANAMVGIYRECLERSGANGRSR